MGLDTDICSLLHELFFSSYVVHLADSSLYASLSEHMDRLHWHLERFETLNCDFNILSAGDMREWCFLRDFWHQGTKMMD